jgi:succinyl-CoA synthetase beta subunit
MKIHEYQAKQIFEKFGVPIPRGRVVETADDAAAVAKELGGTVVVKAQIHAGGRGKGGGVKLAQSPDEAKQVASEILGMTLVTHQTGPEGRVVKKVLVEEGLDIEQELYAAVIIDRAGERTLVMASSAGGMDIEEVAAKTPEKILRAPIDPGAGISPYVTRKIAYGLSDDPTVAKKIAALLANLYRAFTATDASLAEINPLVVTKDGDVLALDAKMNFDDNALFRHPDIVEFRDLDEEEPLEIEASKHNLSYIKLDGAVGCMVNGAGLAMATMDIIKLAGSEPANFLDVGGTASVERVASAFRILMSDKNVRAVLINIFGGIVRCDRVAKGVIEAIHQVEVDVPIVVRLEGTNAEEARDILEKSDLEFTVATDLRDAADKVVAALGKKES